MESQQCGLAISMQSSGMLGPKRGAGVLHIGTPKRLCNAMVNEESGNHRGNYENPAASQT